MIVKVVKKNEKDKTLVFRSHELWGGREFQASSKRCGGYSGARLNSSYLYFTSLGEKELLSRVVQIKDGIASDLSNSQLIKNKMYWLDKIQEIPKGNPNVFWSYCESNEECIQAKDSCNEHVGLNKKYKANYDGYIEKNKFPLKCTNRKKDMGVSKCIENFCS